MQESRLGVVCAMYRVGGGGAIVSRCTPGVQGVSCDNFRLFELGC